MANQLHEDIVMQAHYQIEAMCDSMLKAARSKDTETLPYLVQALVIRIDSLNEALMGVVDDDVATANELRFVVNGMGEEALNG